MKCQGPGADLKIFCKIQLSRLSEKKRVGTCEGSKLMSGCVLFPKTPAVQLMEITSIHSSLRAGNHVYKVVFAVEDNQH